MRRISRRGWLAGAAGVSLAGAGFGLGRYLRPPRGGDRPERIAISAEPIPALRPSDPARRRFGDLAFRSGLVLRSTAPGFGGLSGLWRSPDGSELVAITDNAQWLTARAREDGGRLAALDDARLSPILGPDGTPLRQTPAYDTEALAIADGQAFIGVERVHQVLRFDWARERVAARGQALALPTEVSRLPANGSLEALAVAPPGHPLAGRLVAVAERAVWGSASPTRGWVLTGPSTFGLDVARQDGFDITDMAFLPGGDLLLLERSFVPGLGNGCRIRRVGRDAIVPDALIEGRRILDLDRRDTVDNMEGLAIHRDPADGGTILTLVSDDNFSRLQRTLLLEFTLEESRPGAVPP